jgi:nucleoside-diphosphate-sugar epimerase
VYGPFFTESDNRVYAQFIRNVLRGENIVLKSRGEQFRSWLYVADCASALLHLLLKGESGQAYNIANPESNVTILELARTVASLAPGEPKPQVVFDIPNDGTQGNTTPITKAVFSTKKIEGLGWRPHFTLEQGLKHTLNALL